MSSAYLSRPLAWLSVVVVSTLFAIPARGQQILEIYGTSLEAYLAGASPVQGVQPLVNQRGVNVEGSQRAAGAYPWALAGNPFENSWVGKEFLGDLRLDLGTYSILDVDIELPGTGGAWRIGRTYNLRQKNGGSYTDSNGPQGYNWFQIGAPEIKLHDDSDNTKDVVYLLYGADRYLEFQRTGSSSTIYKGKNGAAGIFLFTDGGGGPDTWTYVDQHGNGTRFFGFDGDSAPVYGQFWSCDSTVDNTAVYVGHKSNASTAISTGFDANGRVTTLYDAADRRYSFTYSGSTIGGVKRLEQVKSEVLTSGTWASSPVTMTVAQVDYSYYGTGESYGLAGDLKHVVVSNHLNYDAGTSTPTIQTKKQYFRYWTASWSSGSPGHPHALKYVYGAEGLRQQDWVDTTFDEDYLTASDDNLKPYASAYFEYDENDRRVTKAWFSGQCGCSGGGGDGTFEFSYHSDGYTNTANTYDTAPATRAVVKQPDASYLTQHYDETGQGLSHRLTNTNPETTSPTQSWPTLVTRDASGLVSTIYTATAVDTYSQSAGTGTGKGSTGLLFEFPRETSGNLTGFPLGQRGKAAGTGSTASYESSVTLNSFTTSFGGYDVVRPLIASHTVYPTATSTPTGGNTTSYSWAKYSGSNIPEGLTVIHPIVATGNNGSGAATYSYTHFQKDGTPDWEKGPDGAVTFRTYTNGQATKVIEDADTSLTSSGQDFYNVTVPTVPSGASFSTSGGISELHRRTELSYDAQGRLAETKRSYRTHTAYAVEPIYHTKLADDRGVTLAYADYDSSATRWYGPVQYAVVNQSRQADVSAVIAVVGDSTTAAQTTHIQETDADPITAVDTASSFGSLVQMSVKLHSATGSRLESVRSYFMIPGSGVGSDGTNYDEVLYGYDSSGRRVRTLEPHGTITRTVFDSAGRVSESWLGTNDASFPGGSSSGTDNMVKVESRVYDGGSSGGINLLTERVNPVDSDSENDRTTTYTYSARGRLIVESGDVAPFIVYKLDNLGRRTATGYYSSTSGLSATTDPTSTATNRLALEELAYDELGRVWKTSRHKVSQSDGSLDTTSTGGPIESLTWFNAEGQVVKSDGSQLSKQKYDALGRLTDEYILARDNDSSYADADDVSGDIVLEEHQSRIEATTGNEILSAWISRHHTDFDDTTPTPTHTTGPLDTNADADALTLTAANVLGRAQITVYYYDTTDRLVDEVGYGTYNGSTFSRPSTVDSRSDTALRTTTTYNLDGTVKSSEDPKALKTFWTYDARGRELSEVRNWDGTTTPTPSGTDDNVTVRYEYVDGLRTKLIADMPSGQTDQETLYIHGTIVGTPSASKIATGHLVRGVIYPDSTNAGDDHLDINTDSSDVVSFAYNRQQEEVYRKDQVACVIETDYDKLGRNTQRRVTALGGFDGAVERIATAYDALGRYSTVSQYDDPTVGTGSILDQVQFLYDSWGNVEHFKQDRDSAVGASGSVNDYQVRYEFEKKTSGRNTVRRKKMWLPGSTEKEIRFSYSTRDGLFDDDCSRVSAVRAVESGTGMIVAWYDYNGVGQVVGTEYTEVGAFSDVDGGGPTYPGLDRFNRIVSSTWTKDLGTDVNFYQVDLTYDRNSNITSAQDGVHAGFDVLYSMDDTNRLARAEEGTLGGGSISSRTRDQQWTLSHTGNWARDKVDLNGDGDFADTDEVDDTRAHNDVNELETRDTDSNASTNYALAYDAAGNLIDDGKDYEYVYDAFYRLREVRKTSNQALVAEFRYNGLGYRIGVHEDTDVDGDVDSNDLWYYDAYDERWRQVARFRDADTMPKEWYVHHQAGDDGDGGSSYIDLVVCRYKDTDAAWTAASDDATLEERLYYCQNWRADVSAIVGSDGSMEEWVKYSAYGVPFLMPAGDAESNGDADQGDKDQIGSWISGSQYDVRGDLDLDGDVDSTDQDLFDEFYGVVGGTHVLSAEAIASRRGYSGGRVEASVPRSIHFRNRELYVDLGRWGRRDPLTYVDGVSLYQAFQSNPQKMNDPDGTVSDPPTPGSNAGKGLLESTATHIQGPPEQVMPPGPTASETTNCCLSELSNKQDAMGWVMCCKGTLIVCNRFELEVNPLDPNKKPLANDAQAKRALKECVNVHEYAHKNKDGFRCPKGHTGGVIDPMRNRRDDTLAEKLGKRKQRLSRHAEKDDAERGCLQGELKKCTTAGCKQEVNQRIADLQARADLRRSGSLFAPE